MRWVGIIVRSSCKVNLVGVDGLLRLDGSHGNYVIKKVKIYNF